MRYRVATLYRGCHCYPVPRLPLLPCSCPVPKLPPLPCTGPPATCLIPPQENPPPEKGVSSPGDLAIFFDNYPVPARGPLPRPKRGLQRPAGGWPPPRCPASQIGSKTRPRGFWCQNVFSEKRFCMVKKKPVSFSRASGPRRQGAAAYDAPRRGASNGMSPIVARAS
jgi:hypothetical protein